MRLTFNRKWLPVGLAAVVVLVMAYAWIDGGREELRDISEPVALPEAAR